MKRSGMALALALLAVVVSASMVGCGVATAAGTTGTTGTAGATGSVTAASCQTPTAGASAAKSGGQLARTSLRVVPVTTLPPGLTPGEVRVVVEQDRYGACDTIPVWAGNGLDHSISATDHQSDCTIVTLQHRVADTWETLARCLLATPTRVVVLASMHANFIPLAPGGSGAQGGGAWPAGTYRIAFSYYEGSEPSPGSAKVVYSPTFTIG